MHVLPFISHRARRDNMNEPDVYRKLPWSNVVGLLVAGASLVGMMAFEPVGTLGLIAAGAWYYDQRRD